MRIGLAFVILLGVVSLTFVGLSVNAQDWNTRTYVNSGATAYYGTSVACEEKGDIWAIGSEGNDGWVRLRQWGYPGSMTLLNWFGSEDYSDFGQSVSLSYDGHTVAAGAPDHTVDGSQKGLVVVRRFDGTNWNYLGDTLFGGSLFEEFGYCVNLDSSGNTIAVGVPSLDVGPDDWVGAVRVYQWNGAEWLQKGSDLSGSAARHYFGYSVALSADGNTLVVGSPQFGAVNSGRGIVRVFRWTGSAWEEDLPAIYGSNNYDRCGYSVSIDAAGRRIAYGCPEYNNERGVVRIHEWDGQEWVAIDSKTGIGADDYFGRSVDISLDGKIYAVGATENSFGTNAEGYVEVFIEEGVGIWNQHGSTIHGEEEHAYFGAAVALDRDGDVLVVGEPRSGSTNTGGSVSSYIFCTPDTSFIQEVACDSYTWDLNGHTYHNSGTYPLEFSNIQGCDSVVILQLTIAENAAEIDVVACETYVSPSGNYTWTQDGSYVDTVMNIAGCDSVITINLNIANNSSSIEESACYSYVSPSGNQIWQSSGVYTDVIQNSLGCDSVITIDLTILNSESSMVLEACNEYISPSGNYSWNTSGVFTDTVPNSAGCDSVITIDLTVLQSSTAAITEELCGPSYVSPSGLVWTQQGSYVDTISNAVGCDSIITIELISNNTSGDIVVTQCGSYTSPSGDHTWTTSGTYTDVVENAFGCDSVITIDLTIPPVNTGISVVPPTLTASQSGAVYQWLDCEDNYSELPGETGQSFTATENGEFAFAITQNGCTDTSSCFVISGIGIDEIESEKVLSLFPNPVADLLFIEIHDSRFNPTVIAVKEITGREVLSRPFAQQLDVSELSSGNYILSVFTDNGVLREKVVVQ